MSNLQNMTDTQLREFAARTGITYTKACSLRDNALYREAYAKKYNRRPDVRVKRHERNRVEYNLRKALKEFAKESEE